MSHYSARVEVFRRLEAEGMKREAGALCLMHNKAGAAPATVSESHERRMPLCLAREGALRGRWTIRLPLASPETGHDDFW